MPPACPSPRSTAPRRELPNGCPRTRTRSRPPSLPTPGAASCDAGRSPGRSTRTPRDAGAARGLANTSPHSHALGVGLHRGHRGAGLRQGQRERAQPGPDLDHPIAGTDARQAGDAADRVGVDDEVLAEGPPRAQTVLGQQVDDLPARESHATIAYRWARSKTRSVLAQVAASTSATSTPRAAATAEPTIGTR